MNVVWRGLTANKRRWAHRRRRAVTRKRVGRSCEYSSPRGDFLHAPGPSYDWWVWTCPTWSGGKKRQNPSAIVNEGEL